MSEEHADMRITALRSQLDDLSAGQDRLSELVIEAKTAVAELTDQMHRVTATVIAERDALREVLERMAEDCWNGCDIDGGFFQDLMVEKGLMVEVPASQEFRDEYDSEVMYQLTWKVRKGGERNEAASGRGVHGI